MFRDNFPGSSEVIWKRFSVLIVLPVLIAGWAAAQNQAPGGPESGAPPAPKTLPGLNDPNVNNAAVDVGTYIIGPNDILNIDVFKEQAWSHGYQVRTDGMISVPLVGELRAAGLTPKQLETQLTQGLKDQAGVLDPLVTVSVYSVQSKKYSVTGQVKRPGPYPLIGPTTVFDAINDAGGFLDNFSDQKHITVIRGDQRLPFNYKDYVAGKNKDKNKNIALENGDVVSVK